LIRLARAGDEDAAARLAREFEPFVRRFVRFRMRCRSNQKRLRRETDSADICQSVFKSLFVGLRDGKFILNRPEQLAKLLSAMARFKVATRARRLNVTLREMLEVEDARDCPGITPGPDKVAADRHALETILKLFDEDELDLLIRRLDDQPWSAIAGAVGGTAEGLRKKLVRAIDRVRAHPELQHLFES
jgi:hypothetical protein